MEQTGNLRDIIRKKRTMTYRDVLSRSVIDAEADADVDAEVDAEVDVEAEAEEEG